MAFLDTSRGAASWGCAGAIAAPRSAGARPTKLDCGAKADAPEAAATTAKAPTAVRAAMLQPC